ncbi:Med8 protein [Martiniozyma asiatica (nom. inval.)]|nr:Med8 protein [Martiniozyma asiatica]
MDNNSVLSPLEQLRPRLAQLTFALRKIEEQIRMTPPPLAHVTADNSKPFNHLLTPLSLILSQLHSIEKLLQDYHYIFQSTSVYPNREFDVFKNVQLLSMLGKKLPDTVTKWMGEAEELGRNTVINKSDNIVQLLENDEKVVENYVEFAERIWEEFKELLNEDSGMEIDENNNADGYSEEDLLRLLYMGNESGIVIDSIDV